MRLSSEIKKSQTESHTDVGPIFPYIQHTQTLQIIGVKTKEIYRIGTHIRFLELFLLVIFSVLFWQRGST